MIGWLLFVGLLGFVLGVGCGSEREKHRCGCGQDCPR